ncbi:hypothetical protein BC829DRAFT_421171, partial [Chytridium lagenaria]
TSAATVNELLRRPAEIHFTKSDLDLAIDCIAKKKRAETNNESETDKVVEAEETSFTKKLLKKRRAVIESDSDENIQTPKKTMRTRSDDRKEKLSRQIESISGMRKSVSKTLLLIPSATSILGFTHLTHLTHQYLSGSRAVLVCSIGQVGIRVGMTRSSIGIMRKDHSDGSGSPAVEVCGVRLVLPQLKSAALGKSGSLGQVGVSLALLLCGVGWVITRITTLWRWMSQDHSGRVGSLAVLVGGVRQFRMASGNQDHGGGVLN